jgi:hypothetical protein
MCLDHKAPPATIQLVQPISRQQCVRTMQTHILFEPSHQAGGRPSFRFVIWQLHYLIGSSGRFVCAWGTATELWVEYVFGVDETTLVGARKVPFMFWTWYMLVIVHTLPTSLTEFEALLSSRNSRSEPIPIHIWSIRYEHMAPRYAIHENTSDFPPYVGVQVTS